MADADKYEEASLADDFEEASYYGDADVVVKDSTEPDGREHVIKLCFSSLIKFHCRNPTIKAHFIDKVQKFVINNTEIASHAASMILHYIVMYCVETNRDLPAKFCSRTFISRVVNYTKYR